MNKKTGINQVLWWFSRNILLPLIGFALLYFAFRGKDFSGIWNSIKSSNFWWFFVPRIFVLIAHWARAWRWVLQLRTFQHTTSVNTAFHAVVATYFVNIYLPKIGDFYRCWALQKTEKIPFSRSFGTLVIEKFIDLLMLFFFFGIAVLLKYKEVSQFLQEKLWANFQEKLSLIVSGQWLYIGVVILLVLLAIAILFWLRARGQNPFQEKIKNIVRNVWQGIESIRKIDNAWAFVGLSLLIFGCFWLNFQLSFLAMPSTAHLNLIDALFIFTTSAFSQAAPIQGNIGAFHWLVSEALNILKVTPEQALAWATAMHGTGLIFRLVTGSVSILYLKFRGVKISDVENKLES